MFVQKNLVDSIDARLLAGLDLYPPYLVATTGIQTMQVLEGAIGKLKEFS